MVFKDICHLVALHAQLVPPDPDEWTVLENARIKAAKDRASCHHTHDLTACGSLPQDVQKQLRIEQDFASREGPLATLTG